MDSETFPCVLINDSEHTKGSTIMGAVGDKVIGPDMTLMLRSMSDAEAVIKP